MKYDVTSEGIGRALKGLPQTWRTTLGTAEQRDPVNNTRRSQIWTKINAKVLYGQDRLTTLNMRENTLCIYHRPSIEEVAADVANATVRLNKGILLNNARRSQIWTTRTMQSLRYCRDRIG